jgi:1-deoxy-D-xylulose-5-phosphate synthase
MKCLPLGKAETRRTGRHGVAILAFGSMVAPAERIAERHDMTVVNMRFVKPLDEKTILWAAAKHEAIVTVEENVIGGGAGAGVSEALAAAGASIPVLHCGIPDHFIEHGSREDCLLAAGLDVATLEATILGFCRERQLQLSA